MNVDKKYPLYDMLYQKVQDRLKDDTNRSININRICTTINNINADAPEHYQEILALIYHYEIINHDGKSLSVLPYNSKTIMKNMGIIFVFIELPVMLQQIIAEYISFYSTAAEKP